MVEAGGCPVELTYELETVGRNDFFGTLPGAFTAHPKVDPATGEMHAMVYAWAEWMDHVQYVVVGTDGRVRRTLDIPLPGMTMLHDMSLTERYAVVYDQPCTVDFDLAFAGRFPFRWNPDYGNRVGLLPAVEGEGVADIVWIDVPIGYSFHPMNAYDTADGSVVIDLCNYDVMFDRDILGPFGDRGWRGSSAGSSTRRARTASITVIDDTPNEFPRHRGSLTAKPYRYGYCASPSTDPRAGWPTLKHDLQTGERSVFDHGPGRAAGEPVFVGRPGGTEEDDGWLVTFVHDLAAGTAEFVVLDAQDFDRGYVAQVPLPQRVPFGFHGNWVSDRIGRAARLTDRIDSGTTTDHARAVASAMGVCHHDGMAELLSLHDAVAQLVHDGDTVALEGFTHLIPHAAGHEIIRQGRRDLHLVRMTPDMVYDQLIGAGCADTADVLVGRQPRRRFAAALPRRGRERLAARARRSRSTATPAWRPATRPVRPGCRSVCCAATSAPTCPTTRRRSARSSARSPASG